ncbi:MAG: hypothetical protein LJF30_19195 [Acidobacteria bacterium]|nr:hypothetical protein [Acidobacteriota bacterium]
MAAAICVLALLAPASAGPQGTTVSGDTDLEIQHDPVSCLVAGKHPRLLACFSPRSDLARARVFFRAHRTVDWYYVDMAEEAPCFAGVLPKPTLEIGRVDYYVEATSRDFTETVTREFDPVVVQDEGDCEGLLAPFLDKANVVVGSAAGLAGVPQGFAAAGIGGGISTGVVVAGVVGAGAAVGGIAIAGGGSEDPAEPPSRPPVGGPEPSPTPTPPPTPAPGPEPGPEPTPSPSPTPPPTTTTTLPPNQPPVLKYNVPASAPEDDPVTFNLCGSFDPDSDPLWYTVFFDDQANDPTASYAGAACSTQYTYADVGTFHPELCVDDGQNPPECATVPLTIATAVLKSSGGQGEPEDASATPTREPEASPSQPTGAVSLDSQLTVPGATGQIILNGSESSFVGTGHSRITARGQPGSNRIEALLVDGKGEEGSWRFDLTATRLPVEGLRVVAGQTVGVSPSEVVFAFTGRPGERIVFTFELTPAP